MSTFNFPMTWEQAVIWLKNQPQEESLVRACYFDDPLLDAAKRYHREDEWVEIRNFLPQQLGNALDVGAGRGIASYALACDGWTVTALEPNPSELVGSGAIRQLAIESSMPIRIVEEWGECLPFENNTFQLIHARQVLHHAKDLQKLCQELFRVTKPGGRLIATREHVVDGPEDLNIFLNNHPLHNLYGGENAYILNSYLDALRAAGYRIKKVLSPFESSINYFPATKEDIVKRVSKYLFWPFPKFLPDFAIRLVSRHLKTPGRLFSFVCDKI